MVTVDFRATGAPSAGEVIETVGGVTSIGGGEGRGVPCTARNASTRPFPKSWSNPGSPISLAVPSMRERASRLVRPRDISRAPTPATWGVAMEVPLRLLYPLGSQSVQEPVGTEELMATPGAATSSSGPVDEKEAHASRLSTAATAIESGSLAG